VQAAPADADGFITVSVTPPERILPRNALSRYPSVYIARRDGKILQHLISD